MALVRRAVKGLLVMTVTAETRNKKGCWASPRRIILASRQGEPCLVRSRAATRGASGNRRLVDGAIDLAYLPQTLWRCALCDQECKRLERDCRRRGGSTDASEMCARLRAATLEWSESAGAQCGQERRSPGSSAQRKLATNPPSKSRCLEAPGCRLKAMRERHPSDDGSTAEQRGSGQVPP